MEKQKFNQIIKEYAKEISIELDDKKVEQFYMYMELLLEWNEKINLTAITKPEEVILKHFIDSLTIINKIKPNTKIVDVGTGAGFPGIPIKIVKEDVEIVLVDSLNKRIHFLDEVIQKLGLTKIETIHSRAEELGRNKKIRETFDYATSRAVANLSTLSEYLMPFVKVGGNVIAMKGSEIEEELQKAQKAISILGGEVIAVEKFILPKSDIKRHIITIKKRNMTPMKYPRKAGTPAKEPI